MITYNNYENKFIQLADLKLENLPESIEFEGDLFIIKSEFHITLLSVENAAKIIDASNFEILKLEIVNDFHNFVKETPLVDYELLEELRLVNVEGNKTIIVMTKLHGIENLFNTLSQKYGAEIPVQPTHITLYTLPPDTFGIPINSYEELEKISKPIEIPKLKTLL